jgi:hypothetical protein
MDDAVADGVRPKGEKNPMATLTDNEATQIRREYVYGSRTHGLSALATKYGVSVNVIRYIVIGASYCHLLPPEQRRQRRKKPGITASLFDYY